MMKISQNFVAFSEYMNFTSQSYTFVNEIDHLIVLYIVSWLEYLIDFWLNLKVVAIQYSNQEPVIWIWLT